MYEKKVTYNRIMYSKYKLAFVWVLYYGYLRSNYYRQW